MISTCWETAFGCRTHSCTSGRRDVAGFRSHKDDRYAVDVGAANADDAIRRSSQLWTEPRRRR